MSKLVERIELCGGRYDGMRLVLKDPLPFYKVVSGSKDGEIFPVQAVYFKRADRKHGKHVVYELVERRE